MHIEKTKEIKNKCYMYLKTPKKSQLLHRQTDPVGRRGGSSSYYIVHTYNRAVGRSENPRGRGSSNVVSIICPPWWREGKLRF